MARAYQHSQPDDFDREGPGEWQTLRNELVALLDQVDGQVSRSREGSLSERVRDLRHQVTEVEYGANSRHRDALRTVQRQISRFEEPAPLPPNPRDSLQAAINQIRTSQGVLRQQNNAAPAPQPARASDGPMLERLAQSVNSISGRLEGIESEIRAQVRTGANVKDVADQVAQLAHVVELLAGAVGETGQVKRLEGQIASLGKIMSQGREMDLSTLTRRLDDVASTVGKLAELQVHFTEKVQNPIEMDAFKDGMRSIEDSVRNVYDRIDALERNRALAPRDLDIVTSEMARFTAALQEHNQPNNLVELVDALNVRISEIESGDRMLHALRKDLSALRDAVVVSIAPRFDAIEEKLTALSSEVGTRADMAEIGRQIGALGDRMVDSSPNIAQIEAQVRQLVARMDQTGEQLQGLAKMYAEPGANVALPEIDFDAMAEMVANRAADAMSRQTPDGALTSKIGALEERITAMLQNMQREGGRDQSVNDFGGMQAGIDEVNERLKRLETSLMNRPAAPSQTEAVHVADIAAIIADANAQMLPRQRDTMPISPATDAPLSAAPFPDPDPTPVPLAHKRHPGLDEELSLAARHDGPPPAPTPGVGFEPPPAPVPSAAFLDATPPAETKPEPVAPMGEARVSTNTFIEAARRMSQRQTVAPAAAPASNSLIGRALSRFHNGDAAAAPQAAAPVKTDKPAKAAKPAKAERPSRAARALAGDKPTRNAGAAEVNAAPSLEPQIRDEGPKAHAEDKPGFLARNRRPILLAALLVGVSLLAANLALQRMRAPAEPANAAPITTGDIADDHLLPADAFPEDDPVADADVPRVIDMDPIATGNIDTSAAMAFTTGPLQTMPSAFGAASGVPQANAIAPLTPVSPIKVEMPAEGIGPVELRQAAADGDSRAQFEVAAILTEGRAVPQDYAAAAVWYERAAASGFPPAQYRLGSLYENGNGIEKDLEKAKLWYERAAEAGNRMAMHNLAALYANGALGQQEFESAAKWFEEAASRGMTDSQFNLGMLYARGLGVPQNLEDSFKWFGIAARSGDADAAKAREDMARSLDAETMTRLTDVVNNFQPVPIDLAANFAPIGTWSAQFDPGETIASRDIVSSVQKALGKLGYDVGTPDGIAGAKTQTAIKLFEQATGMSPVGLINPRLLAVLGSQPV